MSDKKPIIFGDIGLYPEEEEGVEYYISGLSIRKEFWELKPHVQEKLIRGWRRNIDEVEKRMREGYMPEEGYDNVIDLSKFFS